MIDFVARRKAQDTTAGGFATVSTFPTDIRIGDTYIARDKRRRENRLVQPATVIAITRQITGNVLLVSLKHPTCITHVRLDRFRKHYVLVSGNSNGSN